MLVHCLFKLKPFGASTKEILELYEDHFQHDLLPTMSVYDIVLGELSGRSMQSHGIMLRQQLQNNASRLSSAAVAWSDGRKVDVSTIGSPDAMHANSSLAALQQQSDEDYAAARRILGTLGKEGRYISPLALNALLACAAVRGDIDTALSSFGLLEGRASTDRSKASPESFKNLLLAYTKAGEIKGAETVFEGFLKGIGRAEKRIRRIPKTASQFLQTDLAASSESSPAAPPAVDERATTEEEDVQVWNAMMRTRLSQRDGPAALELLERMMAPGKQTPYPSASTLLTLIRGFAETDDLESAFRWANRVHTLPTPSDLPVPPKLEETLNTIISTLGDVRGIQDAASKTPLLPQLGMHIRLLTGNSEKSASLNKSAREASPSSDSSSLELSSIFSDQSIKTQTLSITPPPLAGQLVPDAERVHVDFVHSSKIDDLARSSQNPLEVYGLVKSSRRDNDIHAHPEALARLVERLASVHALAAIQDTYLIAYSTLSSLPSQEAQTAAWAYLEDRMLVAMANMGELEKAAMHRDRLLQAGAAPSADAYAAMITSARDTTDDATVALELFEEARRFGVAPNLFLFNILISKLSKARRTHLALSYFEQMKAVGIRPSTVSYGCVIAGKLFWHKIAIYACSPANPVLWLISLLPYWRRESGHFPFQRDDELARLQTSRPAVQYNDAVLHSYTSEQGEGTRLFRLDAQGQGHSDCSHVQVTLRCLRHHRAW